MKLLRNFAAIAIAVFLTTNAYAQFSAIGIHARVSDMANSEANGGGSSALIGINAGGVNNWSVNQWDLSSIEGRTVTEVTLTFAVARGFTNANHGSALDTISVHELFDANAGWTAGTGGINSTNVETGGAVTFNFQSQTSETEGVAWRDANGDDVPNFLGAFDQTAIDSVDGYAQGEGPELVEYTIPIALAQSWVDDPASFAGLVLVSNDNGDSLGRFNFFLNPATLTITTAVVLGDVNMDGMVSFDDIAGFIAVLADSGDQAEADIDENGTVDFDDIGPFIELLSGT